MADLRVPKSMPDYAVIWAFRHGVSVAMRMNGIALSNKQHSTYAIAPRNVLRLADRVRLEWERRHGFRPQSDGSGVRS